MTDFLKPSSCWILWDKGFSEDVSFAQYEMAWTSFESSAKKYDKSPNQKNKIHPTQKPVSLYQWIYKKYAKKGFKILDTHYGSGSHGIAIDALNKIEKMELTLVASEIDKDYYQDAKDRFEKETVQLSIF